MEATSRTQMKVGVFLLAGVLTIMISIFMLGGDKVFLRDYATLHAHFDQVQGLAEGSVVSLAGVNIGNVERIDFDADTNLLDVVLRIEERYLLKLKEGAAAEIRTQGALGDKFVYIIPGDTQAQPLKDGGKLVVAKTSDIFGIISERGKETDKIFDIIDELHRMTKTINAGGRLEKVMIDMTSTTANLKETSETARRFSAQLDPAAAAKFTDSVEKLDSIMAKLDKGQGTLGALINDPSLHEQLKALLGGSQRGQNIKSLIRTSIEKTDSR